MTFNNILILESPFDFDAGKNMANRTKVCSLKTWIEETLTSLKTRGVIKEKMLSYYYWISKTGNTNSIKWERCPYVVTFCLEKIEAPHWSRSKFLIMNFSWVQIMNFIPDWEWELYWMFYRRIFPSAWKSSKKKGKLTRC